MIRWWKRHFIGAEFVLALSLAGAFAVWAERTHRAPELFQLLEGNRGALYGTLASVSGALLGFVITALSIVLSFSSDGRLALLRNSPHYGTLWRTFTAATWALATSTVVALAALVFDRDKSPSYWLTYAVLAGALLAAFRMARCVWILEKVVWVVADPP